MAVEQEHVQEFVNEMEMSFNVRSYSGRGMYGDSCVAITVNRDQSMGDALARIFEYGVDLAGVAEFDDEDEKLIRSIIMILQSARTDDMGTGSIIYFPTASSEGVRMPDKDEDDEGTEWKED